jgi:anti-sigma factor RsiW
MRCSSCESLLDQYVDATLPPRQMHAVAAHIRTCPSCAALHDRLRVVDGLLHTHRMLDLAPGVTGAVMARVRAMPAPRAPRQSIWIAAAFYLICAWGVVFASFVFLRTGARSASAFLARLAQGGGQAVTHAAHAVVPILPVAVSVMVSVLAVDVLLLAAVIVFYRTVRPRLTAHLASAGETLR